MNLKTLEYIQETVREEFQRFSQKARVHSAMKLTKELIKEDNENLIL